MAKQNLPTWEFKFTLFGVEKVFTIKAATMEAARKDLDRIILSKLQMTSAKEKKETIFDKAGKQMEDILKEGEEFIDRIFGGKK